MSDTGYEDVDRLPEATWTAERSRLVEIARKAVAEYDAGDDNFGTTLWDLHGELSEIDERERLLDE